MPSNLNLRFIFTVGVLVAVVLVAVGVILIGYEEARRHAIGNFAPVGQPTNFGATTKH